MNFLQEKIVRLVMNSKVSLMNPTGLPVNLSGKNSELQAALKLLLCMVFAKI